MAAPNATAARLAEVVPAPVLGVLDDLVDAGHAAYVVGGSLRDALLGRAAADWDLASDARPERLVELFHGAVYENRFGTVAVRREGEVYQVTTFRVEHDYADHRRPHRVEFADDLTTDLARRDFTVNAIAWGRTPGEPANGLVDPFEGALDIERRLLRAVGDPGARFEEDALRMLRAVRLAATLGFDVEPATLEAIRAHAPLSGHLSGERVGAELEKLLAAPKPSTGLRLAASTGLLDVVSPELAGQRGIPQNKVAGEDLWGHTLRTVDAAPAERPVVRLAALLHDVGKPATLADGHFHHHDVVGARLTESILRRLRFPRAAIEDVAHLVRQHMFVADPELSDAAVRRFLKRIGARHLDALFALRRADDIGSGLAPDNPGLLAFRARLDAEIAAEAALDRGALAIDGDDLIRELRLEPGPRLGRMLDTLVEQVIADPALNTPSTLLLLAQGMLADLDHAGGQRMIELLLQAERTFAAGRIDEAERLYRQAAAADPRSSIAVVGLARVTLERGDEPGAWRLAGRALEIDPENVAAQRLAQRLEEIYAYRGESIAALAAATGPEADPDAVPDAVTVEAEPGAADEAEQSQPDHRGLVDRLFHRNRP